MRRRRVTRIVLLVLLLATGGAIVNVAVAWTLTLARGTEASVRDAAFRQHSGKRKITPWEMQWYHSKEHEWFPNSAMAFTDHGYTREPLTASDDRGFGYSQTVYIEHFRKAGGRESTITVGNKEVVGYSPNVYTAVHLGRVECGWPMQSMLLALGPSNNPTFKELAQGYRLPTCFGAFAQLHQYVVPIDPIWPGFAINTIFYAAILWLLFFAPGRLRRTIRRRRGLCPACAYPIGDSPVCTECGDMLTII